MEFRASGLARVMQCPGFPFLDLPPEVPGFPAEEGTAAGEYLRHLLEHGSPPRQLLASNGVPFDRDMAFYLTPIAENIRSRAASPILCEQEIYWQAAQDIFIRGHSDVTYIDHQGRLCIDDLKYGWGIVEVKRNWQLIAYAIGEMIRRDQQFDEVVVRIIQPRPHHHEGTYREWVISNAELTNLYHEICQHMAGIAQGNRQLMTGPECKHCPAAAEACPAFNKAFWNGIETAHSLVQDTLNEEQLARQLAIVERASEIIKIKKDSLESLAINRIQEGKVIPGYSVEPKYGHRKWREEFTAETIKALTGFDVTETTLMSPAKAEKLGIPKEFMDAVTKRELIKFKLVPKDSTMLADKLFGTEKPR